MGSCGCGAPIRWVATSQGARVALDAQPHPAGNVVPGPGPGGVVVAHVLTDAAAAASVEPAWRPHLAVCPLARPDRRARPSGGGLPMSTVRCPVCGQLLPVALLHIAETTHPTCQPLAADARPGPAPARSTR